jgi:glycyl-tRNA synthetase beta chain
MNFLLEIGTEEIPHWMIDEALRQLSKLDLLGAAPLVDATPRRLVVQARGIPERTPDQEKIVKGPPLSAGEKAAAGFAKKNNVDVSSLQKMGEYYELRTLVPGSRTLDIFSQTLPAAILGIQWPKTMYWTAKNGPRFIRPIRWIVALLDDQVIPFEIAGVRSGNITRGHRQLGAASIPVTIENYSRELLKNFVLLSSHRRQHKIEEEAAALGAKIDRELLETLTFITEYPTAIRGDFDPEFLSLPAEVLTTVMRHHQKYFSVSDPLEPHFVAVMNTGGDPDGLVKHGNERVLKARFNDARFFWNVDHQRKLEDRVQDLAKVTFHVKLGSYLQKTERVVALVKELGGGADAEKAARLCKTDLTTEMVKEFTELQGVVGGLYARAQGAAEPVWRGIYDHYKPTSMEDGIPSTREGQIVSLADKLDTLRECFKAGMIPSGSKDPFALRRAAQGLVRILIEGRWELLLSHLAAGELLDFLMDRVRYYFTEVRGFKYDEVNAVFASLMTTGRTLYDAQLRLEALAEIRPSPDFEAVAASFKRIRNILKQAGGWTPNFNQDLLEAGPEVDLYQAYLAAQRDLQGKPYRAILTGIASLRPRIDDFFDHVLVNAQDPKIRNNRLGFLTNFIVDLTTFADFSEIVTAGEQK